MKKLGLLVQLEAKSLEKKKMLKSSLQVHCHLLMKKRVLLNGTRSVLTLLHLAFLTLFR